MRREDPELPAHRERLELHGAALSSPGRGSERQVEISRSAAGELKVYGASIPQLKNTYRMTNYRCATPSASAPRSRIEARSDPPHRRDAASVPSPAIRSHPHSRRRNGAQFVGISLQGLEQCIGRFRRTRHVGVDVVMIAFQHLESTRQAGVCISKDREVMQVLDLMMHVQLVEHELQARHKLADKFGRRNLSGAKLRRDLSNPSG